MHTTILIYIYIKALYKNSSCALKIHTFSMERLVKVDKWWIPD